MRIRKFLKYAVAAVLGLLLVLVAGIWLLNVFDEDLNPDIVALVKRAEAETITQEGNAYFPIRGLYVPRGQNIEATGKALHEAERREIDAVKEGGNLKRTWPPAVSGALKFQGESSNVCTVTQDFLYERGVCKSQAETDRMFRDNAELLQRYYGLLDYRTYEEPATFAPHIDADLISLMRLANADMERKLDQGQVAEAARLMVRNLSFWRSALDGKYRLMSQAILQVNYSYSLTTLSELLWRAPELLKRADFRVALAESMKPSDGTLQDQMDREFMSVYFVKAGSDLLFYEGTGGSTSPLLKWLANQLYQRNATLNGYYACLRKYYAVRALGGLEHDRAVSTYQDYDIGGEWGNLVTNLSGKLALLSVCPEASWFVSMSDEVLEARRRLILLEIRLLDSNLAPARYPALLQSADASLHDPLTGKPAKWDKVRRIIYFERDNWCIRDRLWVSLGPTRDFARCPS